MATWLSPSFWNFKWRIPVSTWPVKYFTIKIANIGGPKVQGRKPPIRGQNSFIFMQFSEKNL